MKNTSTKSKKILLLSYSFSGQTNGLLRQMAASLEAGGITVIKERISPTSPLRFPTTSTGACLKMMVTTFIRQKIPIEPLSEKVQQNFDLIIIAGPTWSYNPSGPILSLIDRDGATIFKDKTVIPLISCRGYWRVHWFGLRHLLNKCGATVPNCIVFSHPNKEPWRTIGVFLKIAGKNPERHSFFGKYYQRFGHSKKQQKEAARFGKLLGEALKSGTPLETLNFHTTKAIP